MLSAIAIYRQLRTSVSHRIEQAILDRVSGAEDMAIWQYPLTLLPEEMLLRKYEVLPPAIPMEWLRISAGGPRRNLARG